jgi:dienelactone hydrolase
VSLKLDHKGEEIEIAFASGGSLKALLARPAGPGPWPGVIVIHQSA